MPCADSDDPIVITGIGLVSPLGADRESTWQGVLAGRSAARRLTSTDWSLPQSDPRWDASGWIGCPAVHLPHLGMDRVSSLAVTATEEALLDARVTTSELSAERIGCVFGTSKGSLFAATEDWLKQRPGCFVESWPSTAAAVLNARFGWQGPCLVPVAACATGAVAAIRAAALIREGACDVAVAGSADDSLHPLVLASFQRLGVLARHAEPHRASRPFDRDRNGFVIGSGAGCLVLERHSHALARGLRPYAALTAGLAGADPTGLTTLDVSGETLARLIVRCWQTSTPPDAFSLHGTGTRLNDVAECFALRQAFPSSAETSLAGSFKGALGHLLGAAGSVELALCCLMLRDQCFPPNVNCDIVDPQCRLHWVGPTARQTPLGSMLKIALGFGGHQAVVRLDRLPTNR